MRSEVPPAETLRLLSIHLKTSETKRSQEKPRGALQGVSDVTFEQKCRFVETVWGVAGDI